jgi:hypothetical protein
MLGQTRNSGMSGMQLIVIIVGYVLLALGWWVSPVLFILGVLVMLAGAAWAYVSSPGMGGGPSRFRPPRSYGSEFAFCSSCGGRIRQGVQFCPYCGAAQSN